MQEQIATLIKLQEIDAEIYRLEAQKKEKPALKLALDRELDEAREILKSFEAELKQSQLKQKELEMDLRVGFEDIVKIMVDADMRAIGLEPVGEGDALLQSKFPEKWWEAD